MKTDDEIRRGHRAKQLLEDEFIKDAFDTMERSFIAGWRVARTVEGREYAHQLLTLMDMFRAQFVEAITTGQIGQMELDQLLKGRSLNG